MEYILWWKDGENYAATPLDPRPNFVRGSIEQLDYIRDVNSLVSLAGAYPPFFVS